MNKFVKVDKGKRGERKSGILSKCSYARGSSIQDKSALRYSSS
jgi:hypothetical protein